MAIGGPTNRTAIAGTQANTNGGVRSLTSDAAGKLSGAANKIAASVPADKPITQGVLQDALKDSGLSPELQKSIAGLAPADTNPTQAAAQDQIAQSTAQSKAAGFDTGFGLYGNQKQDITNQIQESTNKLDDWNDAGAIS